MNEAIGRIVAKYGCVPKGTTHYIKISNMAYRLIDGEIFYLQPTGGKWVISIFGKAALCKIPLDVLLEHYLEGVESD